MKVALREIGPAELVVGDGQTVERHDRTRLLRQGSSEVLDGEPEPTLTEEVLGALVRCITRELQRLAIDRRYGFEGLRRAAPGHDQPQGNQDRNGGV